jgi:hypothetical protein
VGGLVMTPGATSTHTQASPCPVLGDRAWARVVTTPIQHTGCRHGVLLSYRSKISRLNPGDRTHARNRHRSVYACP